MLSHITKHLKRIAIPLVALLLVATPVAAAVVYESTITVTEDGTAAHTMVGIPQSVDVDLLVSEGFITATGLDTRVLASGAAIPHLMVDDQIMWADAIGQGTTTTFIFQTGQSALSDYYIIPGYDGYITTADAAAIELADEFEWEIDGWFDTSTVGDIVTKGNDFSISVTATSEITATIMDYAVEGLEESAGTANQTNANAYGAIWFSQTFTTDNDFLLTYLNLYGLRAGNAGDITISIRATSGGDPTGADLVSETVAYTVFPGATGYTSNITFSPSIILESGVMYAIILDVSNGDAGNYIKLYGDNASTYADGGKNTSVDSGVTWPSAATQDWAFKVYGKPTTALDVVATGVTSGEYKIEVIADTVDFSIQVDDVEEDTVALAGVSVTDGTEDYIIGDDDTLPYADYITLDVGGVEVIHYDPAAIIVGTALLDETGASQDGVFTWGEKPSGLTAVMGSMIPYAAASNGTETTDPAAVGVFNPGDNITTTPDSRSSPGTPIDPLIEFVSDITGFGDEMVWLFLAMALTLGAFAIVYAKFQHMIVAGIASSVIIGGFVAIGVLDFWFLVLIPLIVVSSAAVDQRQSI